LSPIDLSLKKFLENNNKNKIFFILKEYSVRQKHNCAERNEGREE
jgi:hypothetical protein